MLFKRFFSQIKVSNFNSFKHTGKEKGFTLMELLVAITIVAIIFTIIAASASQIQQKARDAQRKSDLGKLQLALQQYYTDQGYYPDNMSSCASTKCMNLASITNLSNISGNPNASTLTKVYLTQIPQEPRKDFNHYCYRALKDQSDTNMAGTPSCDNTTKANRCNYYQLFARMEGGSTPNLSCADANGSVYTNAFNYAIGPNDTAN